VSVRAYIDKVGTKTVEVVATDGERGIRIQVPMEAFMHYGESFILSQARERWGRLYGPGVIEAVTPHVTPNARG